MNTVALWGDHVGVGAQDIYVNYNVDWEEKRPFWLCNTALVFVSFCGVALMVQLRAAFLWQNVKRLISWPDILHHPPSLWDTFGSPESGESHLFLWEETTVRKGSRREGCCGETQAKTGPSSGYLQRVTIAGCGQAGSSYGGMIGFHCTLLWGVEEWLIERREKARERRKKKVHREDWKQGGWQIK